MHSSVVKYDLRCSAPRWKVLHFSVVKLKKRLHIFVANFRAFFCSLL